MTATTRSPECSADPTILFVAFELASQAWKVASTVGMGAAVRFKTLRAYDTAALRVEFARAKGHFGLPADAPVWTCHEAGRDAFAPHRLVTQLGVTNLVFDAASIEVPRRQRRAKTDKLDVRALLRLLLRYAHGERRHVRLVRVPSVEVEDRRHLHREWIAVTADRQRIRNRLTSLLATQGARVRITPHFLETVEALVLPDGRTVPPVLMARLRRDWAMVLTLSERLALLEAERHRYLMEAPAEDEAVARVRQLMQLRGIAEASAWLLLMEYFWRDFQNRREVGSAAGLTGTPYDSGETNREQGISKAGNARVRRMMTELAWGWIRFQPESEITQWFQRRYATHGRMRRVGNVAIARRLLIALWRYLVHGQVPAGARLKTTASPARGAATVAA